MRWSAPDEGTTSDSRRKLDGGVTCTRGLAGVKSSGVAAIRRRHALGEEWEGEARPPSSRRPEGVGGVHAWIGEQASGDEWHGSMCSISSRALLLPAASSSAGGYDGRWMVRVCI